MILEAQQDPRVESTQPHDVIEIPFGNELPNTSGERLAGLPESLDDRLAPQLVDDLARGVLSLGTHNVCYAHDETDIACVLHAYEAALNARRRGQRRQRRDNLGIPVIEPVFQIRC